jgi:hypothetical protein
MGNRSGIPVLTAQDMTVNTSFDFSLTNNYGLFIALDWSGQVGASKVKIQASIDNVVWVDYPIDDVGTIVSELDLTTASGTKGIEISEFFADNIRVVYTANTATAGTINAKMSIIDKQDTH